MQFEAMGAPLPPPPFPPGYVGLWYQHPLQKPTSSCGASDFTFPAWSAAFAPILANRCAHFRRVYPAYVSKLPHRPLVTIPRNAVMHQGRRHT